MLSIAETRVGLSKIVDRLHEGGTPQLIGAYRVPQAMIVGTNEQGEPFGLTIAAVAGTDTATGAATPQEVGDPASETATVAFTKATSAAADTSVPVEVLRLLAGSVAFALAEIVQDGFAVTAAALGGDEQVVCAWVRSLGGDSWSTFMDAALEGLSANCIANGLPEPDRGDTTSALLAAAFTS